MPAPLSQASRSRLRAFCVVVHERWTRLVCLERGDGSVRSDVPFGLWPRSVVVAGDRCFGIAQSRRTQLLGPGGWRGYTDLTALDSDTGRLRWSTSGRPATVHPLAMGDGVLIGSPKSEEVRLPDVRDGDELGRWTLPEPLSPTDYTPIFTPSGPDRLLIHCGRRSIVELRTDTDEIRTLLRHDSDLTATGARLAGGLLWLLDRAGYAAASDSAWLRASSLPGAST